MTERIIKALILVALIAGLVGAITWGYEHWRSSVFKQGDAAGAARVKGQWDEDRAKALAETVERARVAAAETLRRLTAQQEDQRAQDELLARTRADRDHLARTADSLQLRASTYLDAAGCGALTGNSATECVRKATTALGNALGQCGQIARSVAADADDNRARGLKCEADYDSLTLKLDPAR